MAPIKGGRKEALADGDMLGVSRGLSEVMGVTRLEVMAGVIWAVVGVTPIWVGVAINIMIQILLIK